MHLAINARLVAIAEGLHAYPSRTRPLSPPAPMVLGPKGPGRVGRCQAHEVTADFQRWLFCCCYIFKIRLFHLKAAGEVWIIEDAMKLSTCG